MLNNPPVVEHQKIETPPQEIFPEISDGSHLCVQQQRPVVERCGQTWVLRAQHLLLYCLTPLIEWLSLGEFTLHAVDSMVESYFCVSIENWSAEEHCSTTPPGC